LHQADNLLTDEAKAMKIKLAIVERLEAIIRESVRPIENIDGIKIIQVDGLTGTQNAPSSSSSGESAVSPQNLAEQIFSSALRYRSQAPLVDAILAEVGLTMDNVTGVSKPLSTVAKFNDED